MLDVGRDDDRHAERARRARLLGERLAALPVTIARVACEVQPVAVPSYPDGPRPSSLLTLEGDGSAGRGEHVGWTVDAHDAWAARAVRLPLRQCATVADVATLAQQTLPDPYDRAVLEAAAIDLALRQAESDAFRLIGASPAPVRYAVSFERVADPLARAARELAATPPTVDLKIDADPLWSDAILGSLADLGRVAVLDFKRTGATLDHERAHRLVPDALLEDPLPGAVPFSSSLCARLSLDAPITSAASVQTLDPKPAAVNVKPARLGGVLEALRVVEACASRGIEVYVGGMFEVDVGRAQLHVLAALLCPDAPNDVAPIETEGRVAPRPPRIDVVQRDAGLADW